MIQQLSKFSLLPEIKQRAVRMRAEGVKLDAIAAELQKPFRTIQDWVLPSGRHAEEVREYKAYLAEKSLKEAPLEALSARFHELHARVSRLEQEAVNG